MNSLRVLFQKLGIYYKIVDLYFKLYVIPKYKKLEKINSKKYNELKNGNKILLDHVKANETTNKLPNTGGIPIETENIQIKNIQSDIIKNETRKTDIESYEGMALNDAIATESWKHYSFFELANKVTQIAKQQTSKNEISILELGCGAGSMFEFFKYLGTNLYIGLDGNPLAFKHSPIIKSNPDYFRLVNLQEEIDFNFKFDLVYTSEVLEHIREDKTEEFIKTISNHMNVNSIFIGTIATTIMDVHINIHPKSWWLNIFKKHQLIPVNESKILEAEIGNSSPYNWNINTSHIFILKKLTDN